MIRDVYGLVALHGRALDSGRYVSGVDATQRRLNCMDELPFKIIRNSYAAL